jgi:hypothetical protein
MIAPSRRGIIETVVSPRQTAFSINERVVNDAGPSQEAVPSIQTTTEPQDISTSLLDWTLNFSPLTTYQRVLEFVEWHTPLIEQNL